MPRPPEGSPSSGPFTQEETEGHAPLSGNGHRPKLRENEDSARAKSRHTYLRRRIVVVVVLALIVLLADAAYAFLRSGALLSSARDSFELAATALADSDLELARTNLERGLQSAEGAVDLTSHPGFVLLETSPFGDDARALDAITEAVRLSVRAGLIAIEGGEVMGAQNDGIAASILRSGQVQFDLLEQGLPYLERSARLLAQAQSQFDVELHPRLDAINRAWTSVDLRIMGAGESVDRLVSLFESLPSLLGEGDSRRYLLAFQAPGEARGTGGVIGLLGVLTANNGRLRLGDIRPYSRLQPRPIAPVAAPGWFQKRYAPFFGLRQWPQVNLSPHFPTVSKVLLRMYREATGRSLDGMIAMDPLAMESLLPAVGPIHQPGIRTRLSEDNVGKVLMRRTYTAFSSPEEQNAYLRGVVETFWSEVTAGDFDSLAMVSGLGRAVATQHLKMYARDKEDFRSLSLLRAAGDFRYAGPNLQMVWNNNVAVNKVDYFLEREIATSIALDESGAAEVITEIRIENHSPAGPPSPLLGPGIKGDPPGLNRMYLNVLLPEGSRLRRFAVEGARRTPFQADEAGFPVVWDILEVPAGEQVVVDVVYSIPDMIASAPGRKSVEFTMIPQASASNDKYSVRVRLPDVIDELVAEEGVRDGVRTVRSGGTLDSARSIRISYE